ncbi:hypothetical protein SK128_014451 [Halocaridina rubra]|uniref:Uncharacterized protein n=1 Tax=Halocaridina rubra TaxID=373956 RepID=A0AAN8WRR7_HALRR
MCVMNRGYIRGRWQNFIRHFVFRPDWSCHQIKNMPSRGPLLLLLLGMTSSMTSSLTPPSAASSPWMDTSLCPVTDSLMVCQLKKGMCSPISTIFSPPGGPVKAVATCANSTGAALGPQFFMSIGLAFLSGSPESLADKASSDPTTATAIRRCALNATGLLNPDMITLNRTTVANSLSSAFITPDLGDSVAAAVTTCPEPIDYKVTDFINCLKVACMNNVAVSPFMSMATAALTGAGSPATKPLPVAAPKPAKKPSPVSVPASAATGSAYSAGAFSYPGAPGAGGAFPYAGAGAAKGGAGAPVSGPSAYSPGAFPYAGAGAFPYAGAPGGAPGAGTFG